MGHSGRISATRHADYLQLLLETACCELNEFDLNLVGYPNNPVPSENQIVGSNSEFTADVLRGNPYVMVVKSPNSGQRYNISVPDVLHRSRIRWIFVQRQVNSGDMVIVEVIAKDSA